MGFHLKLPNIKFLQIEGQNWNDTLHSHNDVYQISVPLQGQIIVNLNSKSNVLTDGHSTLANPFSVHGHEIEKRKSSFMIVGLNREALNNWAKDKYSIVDEIQFDEKQRIFTADLKQQMKVWLTPYLFENENSNPLMYDLENKVFHYFSEVLKGNHQVHRRSLHLASDVGMNRVLEYMHTNYTENLTIEQMAELAQQSTYHFIRSFKKFTKLSPYQYILTLRVEKGKELLCHSTKTITEISYDVGFSSPTHFYRNFIRLIGCTPKQYRDNM